MYNFNFYMPAGYFSVKASFLNFMNRSFRERKP